MPPSLEELDALNEAPEPAAAAPAPSLADLDAMNEAPEPAELAAVAPQALVAAPSAELPPAPPPTVPVIFPDGVTRGTVPVEEAEQARLEGYTLVTPEMEREAALQAHYGDGVGGAIASTLAWGRGGTFGVSDYLGRVAAGALVPDRADPVAAGPGLGAPLAEDTFYDESIAQAAADASQDYRAANPNLSTGFEIASAVAPALVSGGTGAAATAARLTPAGRLASLGMRMAEGLASEATKRGLGAAGRIAAGGLVAGAEGAVDSATRSVMDDFAQAGVDPDALDRVAERMVSAAWDGMLYSAILGTSVMGAVEGVGKLRAGRSALDEADEALAPPSTAVDVPPPEAVRPELDIAADLAAAQKRLDDAAASGLDNGADEAAADVAQLMAEQESAVLAREGMTSDAAIEAKINLDPSPEVRGLLEQIDANLNASKNAQEAAFKLEDTVDELAVSMTRGLDDMQRFQTNVFDTYTNRSNNPKVVKALLERDGVTWNPEAAGKMLDLAEKMEKELDKYMDVSKHATFSPAQLREFKAGKESLSKLREHLTGLGSRGGAPQAGPIAPGAKIMGGTVDDVVATFIGADQFKSHVGTFAAQIGPRPSTSDAVFQRLYMQWRALLQDPSVVGKTLADFQTVKNAAITRGITKNKLFQQQFARAGSSEKGGQFGFADLGEYDAKKIGSMLTNLSDPKSWKEARDFVAGLTANIELMEALGKYYPMPPEALAQIQVNRRMLETFTDQLRVAKRVSVQAKEAKRLAASGSNLQTVIEFVRNLPAGGAALASVAGTAKTLAASIVSLGKGAAKQELRLTKAAQATVKNFVDRTPEEAAKLRKQPTTTKNTPPHLAGLGIGASAVQRAVAEAQALQTADSDESRALDQQLADVHAESPELAAALDAKLRAKAAFIASKTPPPDDSDPFRRQPALIDPLTERSVARYVAAARDPMGALDRLSDGTGTKEDKETLRALYPKLYARFVTQVQAQLKETKRVPTPEQRQRLHFATGIPMSREQTAAYMLTRRAARMAAAQKPDEQAEADQMKPLTPPNKVKTEFSADQRFASRSDAMVDGTD
jgi:hypothetical protein